MGNNLESYLAEATVEYYKNLAESGLFFYEESLIKNFFIQGSCVIDIGCGAGRTTVALKSMGYNVIGMDYSSKMIEVAKEIDPEIEYCVQDVRNMDYLEKDFDCALFSFNGLMLLETYKDRAKALLEINRILKPEGVFFFTTPFLDNKVGREYWVEKTKQFGKSLNQFTKEELIELGDDVTEEGGIEFHIHIPFISEVQEMLQECGFDILFAGRRLDKFSEEKMEDELDDNYLWVVVKRNVQL